MTMADEYKQGMLPPKMHVSTNFQINTFHKFESKNSIIPSLCTFRTLSEIRILNMQSEIWQLNWGNLPGVTLFVVFTRGLCAYDSRLLNDCGTGIELSCGRRGGFATLQRSRICNKKMLFCTGLTKYHTLLWDERPIKWRGLVLQQR